VRHCFRVLAVLIIGLAVVPTAFAGTEGSAPELAACVADSGRATLWAVNFGGMPTASGTVAVSPLALHGTDDQAAAPRRVVAFEYSEGYKTRAKIHKIASFATLPLFAATWAVGQKLYNNPGESESDKGVHAFLGASTGVLFGINSVTGVWNLMEAKKDPSHRTKRTIHGILMLAADAGFFATALTLPDSEGTYDNYNSQRSTHRAMAITSMAIATVGYVMMLFGK
jgi:hypothetical protein